MTTLLNATRQILAANTIKTSIPSHIMQNNLQYNAPLGDHDNGLLIGRMSRMSSQQKLPVDLVAAIPTNSPLDRPGKIRKVLISVVAAAGGASTDTMSFDVLKNAVSILSSLPLIDMALTPPGVYDVTDLVTAAALAAGVLAGDVFTVTRDYTVGAGGTMTVTEVMVDVG